MNSNTFKKDDIAQLKVEIDELKSYITKLKEDLYQSEIWLNLQDTNHKLNQLKNQEKELCDAIHKEKLESLYEIRTGYKITSLYLSDADSEMISFFSYALVLKRAPKILEVECWFNSDGDSCARVRWEGQINITMNDSRILAFACTEELLWLKGFHKLKRDIVLEPFESTELRLTKFSRLKGVPLKYKD